MQSRYRKGSLLVVLLFVIVMTSQAAALNQADILIVRDGHTLKSMDVPEDKFLHKYTNALNRLKNLSVEVHTTDPSGLGPSASYMNQFDAVIWYTLDDYKENEDCPSGDCKTLYEEDVNNLTTYLKDYNGRLLLTGHRIGRYNSGTDFWQDTLAAYSPYSVFYWYNTESGEYGRTHKSEMNTVLKGESKDPVTKNQYFNPEINTTIEPKSERNIFADYCQFDYPLWENYQYIRCKYAEDSLKWKNPSRKRVYLYDLDDDGDLEEYTHSLVRTNKTVYKSILMGIGFEAIQTYDNRLKLMNQSINYLLGPRTENTVVTDSDDISYTDVNESKYINETATIKSTCVNPQIQYGNKVSEAQYFVEEDTGIPENPRQNELGDGYHLSASDGSFGETRETAQSSYSVSNNFPESNSKNLTVALQCRDSGSPKYWGQYSKKWMIADTVEPEKPSVSTDKDYTSRSRNEILLNYEKYSEPYRPDLVRFSCDKTDWSRWKNYNDSKDTETYTIDITSQKIGCTDSDGNKTIYAQGRDYAGNKGPVASDWIVYDTHSPNLTGNQPENQSVINSSKNILLEASDYNETGIETISGILEGENHIFYNGTEKQNFTVNQSLDPDWTTSGEKTLSTYIFDRARNVLETFFTFKIDIQPPQINKIYANNAKEENQSILSPSQTITVEASDNMSNISELALETSSWDNFTVKESSVTKEIDPGWTSQGEKTVKVWINDTVGHVFQENYAFYLDSKPPQFLEFIPQNNSHIKSSKELEARISDRYAGIDTALYNIDTRENHTFQANKSFLVDWSEGTHNITYWVNDSLGFSNRTVLEYTVDDTAPSIDSVTPDQDYLNATEKVTVEASDSSSSIDTISLYDGSWHNFSSSSATLEPEWTDEDLHTLKIRVNDTAGNIKTTEKSWKLDKTPPVYERINPSNNTYINASEKLNIDLSDPSLKDSDYSGSGLFSGTYNDGSNTTFKETDAIDPDWSSSGTYSLQVWYQDNANNTNYTEYQYKVDTEPPAVQEVTPANNSYVQPDETVLVDPDDKGPEGGAGTDKLTFNDGTGNTTVTSGSSYNPGWSSTTNTEKSIELWLNDTLSNSNHTKLSYTVDSEPPSTSAYNVPSSWTSSNVDIDLNATDNFDTNYTEYCVYSAAESGCSVGNPTQPNLTVTIECSTGKTCEKNISFRTNDSAGTLETTEEEKIQIDKEEPYVEINAPENGSTKGGTVSLLTDIHDHKGSGIADASYSIVNKSNLSDIKKQGDLNESNSWNAEWDSSSIDSGTFVFNITASDQFQSNKTNVSFSIDNQEPSVSINSPITEYWQERVQIETTAERPEGSLENHSVRIYDSSENLVNSSIDESPSNPNTIDFNHTFSDGGSYKVNTTAWDSSSQKAETSTDFIVDLNPPSVSFESPENNTWQKGTVSIDFNSTDNEKLESCKWRYYNSSWSKNYSLSSCDKTFNFDTTNCEDSEKPDCKIQVFGEDKAGNIGESLLAFKVDNSPPAVSFQSPEDSSWQNQTFNVSHTETENTALETVEYRIENQDWKNIDQNENITVEIPENCGENGEDKCNVTINATNKANLSTVKTIKFSIDTYNPQIDYISQANNSNLTSEDSIEIEFSDNVSLVAESTYWNGSETQSFASGEKIDPNWKNEGGNSLKVTLIDSAGNSIEKNYQYTLDDTPPQFLGINPENDTAIRQDREVNITAYDPYSGITSSKFDNNEDGVNRTFKPNQTFNPRWDTEGTHRMDTYMEDYAGNTNKSRYEFLVDGSPPEITLVSPENDTVVKLGESLKINASDRWVDAEEEGIIENGEGEEVDFTVNKSFDPDWSSEGEHIVKAKVNDTLNHTQEKVYRFVADDSPPDFYSSNLNLSYAKEGDQIEISANVSDKYSDVDSVRAEVKDDTGNSVNKTLTQYKKTSIYNTTYTAPDLDSEEISVNITANDTFGFSNTATETFYLDNKKPKLDEAGFNLTRPYRGEKIRLSINTSDNTETSQAIATINSSHNPQEGKNLTLSKTEGSWTKEIVKEENGDYNISKAYLKDKVGNSKVVSSGLPEFKVVNHSITVELGGQSYTNAGTVQIANITVEFNRTIENPESRIYLPPSEPESLKETEFNNLTRIECSFGSSCSIDVGRVNGNPSYINLSGEGEGEKASISFEAEIPAPEQDKNYTWTSNVKTNEQESDTRVKTPDLQVSNTYCSGSTDCNVSQFQEFDLEVETENNQTENHTGEAFNVLTAVKNSELGLERKSPEKDIVSGEKANFTFTLNISEAGSYKIGTQAYDNLTEKYTASKKAKINVKDILKPKIEDSWLSSDTVNINETVSIYAEASDNQKIENATFTLENETGIYNLTEEEPVASGDTISKWKAAYNNTSEKGEYNVTDLYVYDREGNLNHTETNLTFQVTELKVLPEVNETGVEIEEPFKILANVTGNSETVQSVEANISKPLGENETIKLQRDENSTSEYTATYRNTSQSGEYQINVTAEAGGTATNQTKNISVSYGKPAIEPLNGENSSIELPQGEIYNITWKIRAENGGLEEVNTSIGVEESTIASNKTAYKEVGDIRYINGYKIVEYKIEAKNTGETEIKLNASSSRNRKDTHTYQVNVTSSDSTEPKITGYRDYPKLVNKHQTVWIEANITDNSIIENATVTVKHPENQSNHTEDPEKMEHVSQDLYRYKFTNTTEIGHYTYEIETWDVSDNKDSVVSHSFNVSENYTVEMELDKNTFVKKDRAEFDLQVEDAKGDPVEGYNLTLVLDKNGTNSTLLPNNQTSGYEYTIKTSDPPSETSTNLPLTYKAHANVSKDGNTGQTIKEFQVTRLLEHKLVSPEGPLSSGEEFEVVVDWKGPTGEPISTNSIVYTICNGCPSDYKYMDLQEPGRYSQTFRVSQNTEDLVSLRLYAIDGYGNSESQDVGGPDGKPPIEPISVGEKDNNTASETGGGGGGAIGGSALQITRLSPRPSLSSDTEQANLSVETSMKSQCYYKNQSIERREMDTASGKIHYKPVKVVSDHTYEYKIYCESGSLNSSKSIIFTVQPKEISTYTLEFPGQLGKIEQGTTVSQPVSFYNNGTAPITIEMEATSDCCSAWFEEEKSVKKIEVEPGSEKTIDLKADIPLNTSLGMHTVTAVFLKGQTSREKVASLQVTESKEIEKLQNLQKDLKSLKRRLQEYEKVGIDVSEIKGTYKEALEQLNYSKTAIKQDNRKVLENSVEEIDNRVEEANTRLKALKLQRYIRENWWKWLLGGLSFYIAFFLITMVGIPYLRLKTEYRKITSEINASIDARKKTEKQYFRREIDRDTFMEIMTEKQDKILQLRGKKEELEEKLDNIFTELVTLENFVKAPIKSFREVSQWWESRKE